MADDGDPVESNDPGPIETGPVANLVPNDPGEIEISFVLKSATPAPNTLASEKDLHIAEVGGVQDPDRSSHAD
jgi:hypothetical protein